jgi:DNA-binding MarR family transcriptional regulator
MTKDRQAAPSAKLKEAAAPRTASATKSALVLALLRREQGSTLSELVDATTWQPHTARAMLTGLRKKGHAIERRKRGDITCYHLPSAGA